MDPLEIINRIGGDNPPSNEEVIQAREQLLEALREAATPKEDGSIDLESARALRNAVDRADEEIASREAAREAAAAEAAELLDGLGENTEGGDDESSEESRQEGGEEASGNTEEEGGAEEAPAAEESVAASADLAAAFKRHRRSNVRTDDTPPEPKVAVTASGPAVGAAPPNTIGDVANLFHRHAHSVVRDRQKLVRLEREIPAERALTASVEHNNGVLSAVMDQRAIMAAGGICAPLAVDYDHPICGDRGRPIRDSLPGFGASRGGVRFTPSATVADLEEAITVWTHDNDLDPSDPETKPCPRVECPDEAEVYVDAIVACLTVGNFQARFNPEFWQSRLDLLMVAHDRIAEQTLFANMVAEATAKTAIDTGNTVRTLFDALNYEAEYLSARHRLSTTALRFVAPTMLRGALRAALGVRVGDGLEAVAAADAQIMSFFNALNINVVWSNDLAIPNNQTAGAIPGFAASLQGLLYPEGTFFFVDGGTLDLGTEVTDSTLNSTNDRQAFVETFEAVAKRGCEALAITVPIGDDCICPPTVETAA